MSDREVWQVFAALLTYVLVVSSVISWRIERRRAEKFRSEVLVVRDLNRRLTKQLVEVEFARQHTEQERDYWHRRSVHE